MLVGEDEHLARTVIVATGATARQLGLESEQKLQGRGVSYCAVCDAAFFKEQVVVVVGGGDSAMEEATFLAKFASKVTIVHRREEFRASPIMVDRARANEKIDFVLDSVVEEVLGEDGRVTGVGLRNVKTGERGVLLADGLFVAIGHDPTTAVFRGILDMDEAGYIVTQGKSTYTNIPGVFAAGDVQDHVYRQAVTAAGSGLHGRSGRRALPLRAGSRRGGPRSGGIGLLHAVAFVEQPRLDPGLQLLHCGSRALEVLQLVHRLALGGRSE